MALAPANSEVGGQGRPPHHFDFFSGAGSVPATTTPSLRGLLPGRAFLGLTDNFRNLINSPLYKVGPFGLR